ncbi:MAG: DUF4212 domain-containing protein [Thermaurantimonas sp.]|uniref:DUF4212 domain-containing protein n=1 Tax=Thermaurantimonas sp. TaxID=2681568 RepID=UPI00391BC7AB
MKKNATLEKYWKENITYLSVLLVIWFTVSYLLSIVFADALNAMRIGGFKLGFWFAQQGSIYTFILLIFLYVRKMNELDKKYEVNED